MENEQQKREQEEYYADLAENSPHETCPNCGNWFDDADFDFQFCHKCGYDVDENKKNGILFGQ